jgi:hypothetical protein
VHDEGALDASAFSTIALGGGRAGRVNDVGVAARCLLMASAGATATVLTV